MLLLGVISIMIIINTIRISVMNRRVEINIMKYVGATDWFIRWPFIVEGIIIGIVGALVPLVLGLPIYTKVTSAIFDYLPVIKFIQFRLTGDVFGFLFPFGIIFGVALGVIGSVSSIRKHRGYKQSEKQNNNEKRGEVFWRILPLSYRIIPFGET